MKRLVPIVEGQSEVATVPILLRRILQDELDEYEIGVARPFRVKRNRVVQPGEMERAVKQAVRAREGAAAVLVLLDADDDCPVQLAQSLLRRCHTETALPVAVVLACRELEAWFLGAKESLQGVRGIRANAAAPSEPETIRGAKERLTRNMEGSRYVEIDDQPAMAQRLDLTLAKTRCSSFAKLVRTVQDLVRRSTPG